MKQNTFFSILHYVTTETGYLKKGEIVQNVCYTQCSLYHAPRVYNKMTWLSVY